jgi:hypothetical protein
MKRLLLGLGFAALVTGCSSSPTTPTTPPPPATPTKIITVSGNLAFGSVNIGSSADRTFTINNSGNTVLTYTSLSCTGGTGSVGYTANPTSGTVAPGATNTVNVHFAPTLGQFYSCVLSVVGDQTSGGAAINVSGTGVNPNPIFVQSGVGNSVFNLPSYVTTVHITGTYTGSSSNFVVWVGPTGVACGTVTNGSCHLLVNDIIGTFVGRTTSDGTYLTGGQPGVVIQLSGGVSWTISEVR